MALKIGNNAVANAFVGSSQVRRAYKGGTLVYQGFSPASEQEFIKQTATGGPAEVLKVYGKSVVNNQLIKDYTDSSNLIARGGSSISYTGGKLQISLASTSSSDAVGVKMKGVTPGRKYLIVTATSGTLPANYKLGGASDVGDLGITYQNFGQKILNTSASLQTPNINGAIWFWGTATSFTIDYLEIVDLTLRFGAGNEPTSVDEALRLLGGDAFDPAYDPGSLQSNKTAELRAERVPVINVWDEEWEIGRFINEGVPATSTTQIRTKNFIPILGGQSYYFNIPNRAGGTYMGFVYFYGADSSFISRAPIGPSNYLTVSTPANAVYMKFDLRGEYGTTYNHDICINLSDPAINGTYYPHWRGSLALNLSTLTGKLNGEGASVAVFPDGMRGVGTDRDTAFGSTGVVRLGKRAYQAGDESDTSVLTDGTNTIYPLATPLTYTLDTPLPTDLTCVQGDILQRVSDNNCPFVGEMKFGL